MVKFRIFLAFVLLISMSAVSFAQQTLDLQGGCTVSIPEGFIPDKDNERDSHTFQYQDLALFVHIGSIYLQGKSVSLYDMEEVVKESLKQKFRDFRISYNEIEKINGRDVDVLYGTTVMSGVTISLKMYVCIIDGYAYTVTCYCVKDLFEKNEPIFDGVAASLEKK